MCKCVCVGGGRNNEEVLLKNSGGCLQICSVSLSKYSLFFPFFSPSLPHFSSPVTIRKGQFSTAWRQHRRTSTAIPTMSQSVVGGVLEIVLFYVHMEGARTLQRVSRRERG